MIHVEIRMAPVMNQKLIRLPSTFNLWIGTRRFSFGVRRISAGQTISRMINKEKPLDQIKEDSVHLEWICHHVKGASIQVSSITLSDTRSGTRLTYRGQHGGKLSNRGQQSYNLAKAETI